MRITYYEGSALSLAQVTKITQSGKLLVCQLAALDEAGRPQVVVRPFLDEDTCEQFFREVICTQPEDAIINLENTSFDPRLGAMLDEFDALYED